MVYSLDKSPTPIAFLIVSIVAKKIVNHLKPCSVTMQPLIQDILDKEKVVEKYAGMATMERIKGLSSTALGLYMCATRTRADKT